jgi:hypothetical protein
MHFFIFLLNEGQGPQTFFLCYSSLNLKVNYIIIHIFFFRAAKPITIEMKPKEENVLQLQIKDRL